MIRSPREHLLAALGHPALQGEAAQQHHRLVGDPVLGEVEVKAGALGDQPLTARRVGGEEIAQVGVAELGEVALEVLPGRAAPAAALTSAAGSESWASIVLSSSDQDSTKLCLPSS